MQVLQLLMYIQITWHNMSFIHFEQSRLNNNFRQFLETYLLAKKVFWVNVNKMPLQNSSELVVGIKTFTVDFIVAYRQFDWLEISLVYNKKRETYHNLRWYNLERANAFIQNVLIENASNIYSVSNKLKYYIKVATQKYTLY